MTHLAELRTDAVVLACAISAGIHGGLVRDHFAEGTPAGLGFLAAAVALAVLAVALTRFPTSTVALTGTAAVLAGLLVSYALAVTTGVPFLHPDAEPVDGVALFTKAVEAGGLLVTATLLRRRPVAASIPRSKGTFR